MEMLLFSPPAPAHKYISVANPAEQTPRQHLSLFAMQAHSEFPARKHRISMQKKPVENPVVITGEFYCSKCQSCLTPGTCHVDSCLRI